MHRTTIVTSEQLIKRLSQMPAERGILLALLDDIYAGAYLVEDLQREDVRP